MPGQSLVRSPVELAVLTAGIAVSTANGRTTRSDVQSTAEPGRATQRTIIQADILPRSMLHRSSPTRLLVTLLLVVAVPFCCCDFRSFLSGCASCGAEGPATGHDEVVAHVDADGAAHDHAACHQHATGHAPENADNHAPLPCGPGNDTHDCNCGKNDGKMLTVQKPTVELPTSVIVAVLDWTLTADLAPRAISRMPYRDISAVARPPTSLLRMHCALIV